MSSSPQVMTTIVAVFNGSYLLFEECWSLIDVQHTLSLTPIMLLSTAGCKNAQPEVPSVLIRLAVGQDLCLDAFALANHVQCLGKVLKRKSCCEQCFRVYNPTTDEIESRPIREQDGHRAKHSNLIIVDAERRERHSGFLRRHAKDHKLATALDCRESAFHGPCHTGDVDDTIKAEWLLLKQLIDIRLGTMCSKLLGSCEALRIEVHPVRAIGISSLT